MASHNGTKGRWQWPDRSDACTGCSEAVQQDMLRRKLCGWVERATRLGAWAQPCLAGAAGSGTD
jgi:hypothetical protein